MSIPTGLELPYRASRVMPATMVGRAKGRSMRALTTRWPGNRSRTRTQAMTVPMTTLPAATRAATAKLRRRAARAWGWVAASQKAAQPSRLERHTTAVSGRTTIRLRYRVTVPRSSAVPPRTSSPTRRLAVALAANRHPDRALDAGHDAGLLVEELLVHIGPTAQVLDREQALGLREVGPGGGRGADRPVAALGVQLLDLLRAEELDEGAGLGGVLRLGDDRDRVLDQDGVVGDDVVDRLLLLLGVDGLVLVREHHVALAADEGLQRLPGRLVLHRHVAEQLQQVGLGLFRRPAGLELGAVGGHDVPLGPARGERVGLDDLDARLDQVVPGAEVLWVAPAGDEHHHRPGDHALGGAGVPVLGDQAGVDQLGHVGLQGEGDDVGGQAVLDGPALVARGPVGLGEGDALAGGGLLELGDQLLVGLPRRRVGDQRQLVAAARPAAAAGGQQGPGDQQGGELGPTLHHSSDPILISTFSTCLMEIDTVKRLG